VNTSKTIAPIPETRGGGGVILGRNDAEREKDVIPAPKEAVISNSGARRDRSALVGRKKHSFRKGEIFQAGRKGPSTIRHTTRVRKKESVRPCTKKRGKTSESRHRSKSRA